MVCPCGHLAALWALADIRCGRSFSRRSPKSALGNSRVLMACVTHSSCQQNHKLKMHQKSQASNGYFWFSPWTFRDIRDVYGLQNLPLFLWPCRRDKSLLHFMLRAESWCHIAGGWTEGTELIPAYMCTMHLAKKIAALGRAVRHVVMIKERKIPPRYPIETLFAGSIWFHIPLQSYSPRAVPSSWNSLH